MKTTAMMILSSSLVPLALAGCPNGCSQQGTCGMYDMCTCYRGYRGADCSERVCPSDYSFVTTPQGDLNFDGDTFDAYLQPIVGSKSKGTAAQASAPIHGGNQVILKGAMAKNTNKFTFDVSGAVSSNELVPGDSVLIDDETFVITAVSTTQPTELLMSTRAQTAHVTKESQIFKMLEAPGQLGGAWESWPGVANAKYDEAHFYMECSNKGMCDRSSGVCKCFEGYEGKACTRAKCPGEDAACSGHGVCQDVSTLAKTSPTLAAFTAKRSSAGSTTIHVSKDIRGTTFASTLPRVRFGRYEEGTVRVTAVASDGLSFDIAEPIDQPLEDFTEIYVVHTYQLWDAQKARTCTCDAGWTGFDCSTRVCPKGDDPLSVTATLADTSTYTQENEKQTISIVGETSVALTGDGAGVAVVGALGLTFTDQYGYAWDVSADHFTKLSIQATTDGTAKKITFATPLPAAEIAVGDVVTFDGKSLYEVATLVSDNSNVAGAGYLTEITTSATFDAPSAVSGNQNIWVVGYAKTIAKALTGLPSGTVPSVLVENRVAKESTLEGTAATGQIQKKDHAQSYRLRVDFTSPFNSGDLPPLGCNTSDLVTAAYHAAVASVTAGSTKVSTFLSSGAGTSDYQANVAVGDVILIGKERRTITGEAATYLTVDRPFGQEYVKELIGVIEQDNTKSTKISCSVTDEPALYWGTVATDGNSQIAKIDAATQKIVTGITGGSVAATCTDPDGGTTCNTHNADSATCVAQTDASGGTCVFAAGSLAAAAALLDSNDVRVNSIIKAATVGGNDDPNVAATTTAPTAAPTAMPTTSSRRRLLADGDAPHSFSNVDTIGAHKYGAFEYRVVDEILSPATSGFTVSEVFDADDTTDEWQYMWVSEKGRTESLECSRRGNCDGETGQCVCYTGFTGAACQTQSALSV